MPKTSLDFSTARKPLTAFSQAGIADIVLLLLIFFLLTSNFIPQFGIQVSLPQVNASAPTEAERITVTITNKGLFYVNQNLIPREQLLESIRSNRGSHSTIVVRADQDATVGQFAEVASIAKALNLRVLMATESDATAPR